MGAWGVKTFENDTALDWLSELEDEKNLTIVVEKFIELSEAKRSADEDEEIDSDLASEILAAAEIVSALLGTPGTSLPRGLAKWLDKKKAYDRALVSMLTEFVNVTDFDDGFPDVFKQYSKEQKWDFVLTYLSRNAVTSIDLILDSSELKELWQESDKYEAWLKEVNELKERCTR